MPQEGDSPYVTVGAHRAIRISRQGAYGTRVNMTTTSVRCRVVRDRSGAPVKGIRFSVFGSDPALYGIAGPSYDD